MRQIESSKCYKEVLNQMESFLVCHQNAHFHLLPKEEMAHLYQGLTSMLSSVLQYLFNYFRSPAK